jgi:hypothetical protein
VCGGWVNGYIQIYEDPQYWPNNSEKKFIDNQCFIHISFCNTCNSLIVNKKFLNIGENCKALTINELRNFWGISI